VGSLLWQRAGARVLGVVRTNFDAIEFAVELDRCVAQNAGIL
jgi:hypothetical protein